ncbi:maltokinase N-terminal cap-like domain-containing protein [Saccharopolyspora sp. ID03-671]|uniref:maltokinase N-terminal cap-like domain-containing protein n=1 Tax=Saccharopolyspora sp. ID03-671 TaxID=3073066 RepID=UPI003873BAC2
MAVVHRATVSPTKQEIATAWLDAHPWGAEGHVEILGSYRFDDPERRCASSRLSYGAGKCCQLPLTYRGRPMDDAGVVPLTTMEHSALYSYPVWHGRSSDDASRLLMFALRRTYAFRSRTSGFAGGKGRAERAQRLLILIGAPTQWSRGGAGRAGLEERHRLHRPPRARGVSAARWTRVVAAPRHVARAEGSGEVHGKVRSQV